MTEEFNKWVNNKVSYQKQSVMRSYAFLLKPRELAQFLGEKKKAIDFCKSEYAFERQDSQNIRQKILNISYNDGRTWDSLKLLATK